MKLKRFKHFSAVNEGHGVLKAQDASKAALFQLERVTSEFFRKAQQKGLADSFKSDISPYNNGYELKIEFKTSEQSMMYRFNKAREQGIEEDEVVVPTIVRFFNNYWSSIRFDVQPETFFDNHLEDDGRAKLNGSYHVFDDRKGRFETVYMREEVRDTSEIATAGRLYTQRASALFEQLLREMDRFNF